MLVIERTTTDHDIQICQLNPTFIYSIYTNQNLSKNETQRNQTQRKKEEKEVRAK